MDISEGDIQWSRVQAGSIVHNGPGADNTLGTPYGYYIYINGNNKTVDFYDFATIQLKQSLKPCSPTCELEFYYHMLGYSDDLDVYMLTDNSKYTLISELAGDFGDKWNRMIVPLGRVSKTFKIEFEGVRYEDGDFDLAIDDVKLKNCEFPGPRPGGCPPTGYYTCGRSSCVEMNKVCDLTDDCGDNTDELYCSEYTQCDFENGLCNWSNDPDGDVDWMLQKGQTPTFATGPKRGTFCIY